MDANAVFTFFGQAVAALSLAGGGIWAALHLLRKKSREEAAEIQIFKAYKDVLDDLQVHRDRSANEINRLAEIARKQQEAILKLSEDTVRLRNDRNKMSETLFKIKRTQEEMIERGALRRPIGDIPTGIFPHSSQGKG